MSLFGRRNSVVDGIGFCLGNALGNAVGNALGNAMGTALEKVSDQAVENITTDMQVANEQKKMAVEEQKKALNLPPTCPHCAAPTTGVNFCEYCKSKIVE